MRIVSGRYRGRRLAAPEGADTRPTADRTRESLFNILAHAPWCPDLNGAVVLDAFCGTGALGLEALSRGAKRATFLDSSDGALATARKNATTLGCLADCLFLRLDLSHLPPPPRATEAPVDLAFLDAPYHQGLTEPALAALKLKRWVKPGGLYIAEVAADEPLRPPPGMAVADERGYGAAKVVFLTAEGETGEP